MVVVHVYVVDASVDRFLDHTERCLVVGANRIHHEVGAVEHLMKSVAIGDVYRPPRRSDLDADRGCPFPLAVQDTDVDCPARTGELIGDPATVEAATEDGDPRQGPSSGIRSSATTATVISSMSASSSR
jgi:hypothetical protein